MCRLDFYNHYSSFFQLNFFNRHRWLWLDIAFRTYRRNVF